MVEAEVVEGELVEGVVVEVEVVVGVVVEVDVDVVVDEVITGVRLVVTLLQRSISTY